MPGGSGLRNLPFTATTPYQNTILCASRSPFPGSRRWSAHRHLVRWNALAMVVRASDSGRHRRTHLNFASAATLYEVAFNHFSARKLKPETATSSISKTTPRPGIYSRARTSKAASLKKSCRTSAAS
jgi:pyruvate dehydrogenase E1 component